MGEQRIVLAIAVLAFAAQLLAIRPPNFYGEPFLVAKNIVAGKGFVFAYPITTSIGPTCYVTPLYVYLQAPFLYFPWGERAIQVMNLLFLQAGCFVVYRFFRRFTSAAVALFSFAALSFYVPFWILAYVLEPNTLNLLLLALTVECAYLLLRTPSRNGWLAFGALIGVQLLVRPDIALGAVLLAIVIFAWHRLLATIKGIALAALLSLVIVSPWTIRNYLTFHKFVLVSANAGMNLYAGNNPVATGEFSELPATLESRRNFEEIAVFSKTHDQIDVDRLRLKMSEEWMMANPAKVMDLDLKKIEYHWFGRPIMGEQFHYTFQQDAEIFRMFGMLMFLFGMWGIYKIRNAKLQSLFLTVFLYSTLVSAIFFVQSRHRILKVDPFLLPLAIIGVVSVAVTFRSRRRSVESIETQRDLKVTATTFEA